LASEVNNVIACRKTDNGMCIVFRKCNIYSLKG